MTVRAPERHDQVAVVSAQPILGRRLLRQSAGLAIIDIARLT
jgi:hypothetical protein